MKQCSILSLLVLALVCLMSPVTQATFSIVAVDTANGIVGGAGASCIDNAQIINDIIESVGAVHTQAWWLEPNQDNAHALLADGVTPDSIIAWLVANDYEGRPQKRQYGVVTLAGDGASASFTGDLNTAWAGHLNGPGYAAQGNILLGPEVVQDMETAFLTTDGPLEKKLMAALEAAKRPGADTRCLSLDKSAISAFIKVVRPGDNGTPFLYEVVPTTSGTTDPIDVLHAQFDTWRLTQSAHADSSSVTVSDSILEADGTSTATVTVVPRNWSGETPVQVDSVLVSLTGSGIIGPVTDNGDGSWSAIITAPAVHGSDTVKAAVGAYYDFVTELNRTPLVTYYLCGDANGDAAGPNVSDLTFTVDYLFRGGGAPPIVDAANFDGAGAINVSDLTYLVEFLFRSGPGPLCD